MSGKTAARKKCSGRGCLSRREGSRWRLCFAVRGAVLSVVLKHRAVRHRQGCKLDSRGRSAQSLRDGIPWKRHNIWPLKTFLSLPTYVCRLFTTPHAYYSTVQIGRFCSNFAPAAHSWGFVYFPAGCGCFPDIVRSTRRCAFPLHLKVIVTPGLKSKQPCLSPWAESCN